MKNTIRFAAFILSLTLSSCGGGEHSATDTGSASFGLTFEEAPSAMKLAPSMAPSTDICSSYGIDSISGTVYNSSNTVIATGGPWACSAHTGTINNIPSGSNLRIAIKGTVSGTVVWQGETTGKTIYAGQDTNVGAISMTYTGNDTTRPTVSAATPTGTTVPLTSPITVTFSEAMASSTIDATTFTLKNGSVAVSGSVTYNSTTRTATFTPTSSLSNSVIYTATVTADVTDMAANKMQSLCTWDFTTEAPPGSAPSAPIGVSATAADKQVTISWTAVTGATSYNLYWSNTTGVTKTNGTKITGTTSPYIHTGLTNGTTYYYVVTAVNSYGESGESSQVNATPSPGAVSDTTAPVNGTTSNFINSGASSTSSTSVTLALESTDAVGVTAYYASETSGTPSPTATGWTSLTSAVLYIANVSFALNSGDGIKTVYVWFKDAAGNVSASANDSITLSTGSIPSAPTGIAVTAGNAQATITWNSVSGATSYNIYWSTASGVTKTNGTKISSVSSPYTHTGLPSGTTYYYVVTAVNGYGESGESSQVSATPVSAAWSGTKQFGTAGSDVGNGIVIDSSGNVYVTGYTYGGMDGNTNAGGMDIFLVKYDSSGAKQWTKQLSDDNAKGIVIDSSGNVYVTGYTYGGMDGNTNAGYEDVFLIKYDSSGAKQWTRQLGSASMDIGQGIAVDSGGNIYMTGYTSGGLDGNTNIGGADIFLVKYDSSGAKQWTRQFGSSALDSGSGVSVDPSGNIYVTGYTSGGLDGYSNAGYTDTFLVKYDSSGGKQWTRQFGVSSKQVWGTGVSVDSIGNIYLTGYTDGGLDGNTNMGSTDTFLVKYDSSATKQWTRQLGSSGGDIGSAVTVDTLGNIYLAGATWGDLDGNTSAGYSDIFLIKYDPSGTKQWTKQHGTSSQDWENSTAVDSNGNVYVTGSTEGGLDGNINMGTGSDVFIIKYDSSGNMK